MTTECHEDGMSNNNLIATAIRFPKTTIERLDKVKGYYSRNKLLLKITDDYLNAVESQNNKIENK
jgi:hypothetical protein